MGKGTAFIYGLSSQRVESSLYSNTKLAINNVVQRHGKGEDGYTVQNVNSRQYRVTEGDKSYRLEILDDGKLPARSERGDKLSSKTYTTFEHFALENLH